MIINSGSLDDSASADYTKIAKAIGSIRNKNIQVSLTDINQSDLSFKPDVLNNQILYGLKGISNVGTDLINDIIKYRPYSSWKDFYNKVKPNKTAMVALIKSGAFDNFQSRQKTMVEYIWHICDKKNNLTLQNLPSLINHNLLPEELNFEKRVYYFNKYLKANNFSLDVRSIDFLSEMDYPNNGVSIVAEEWNKKGYKPQMEKIKTWINANKKEILEKLNTMIFMEDWEKYGHGNLSSWEMDALCFYYHEHELKKLNTRKYGLSNFFELGEEPTVEKTFKKGDAIIPIYKINKICGTCIAKNRTKSIVYLLTVDGVVSVKFNKEYFSMFDRKISAKQEDGTKKTIEKSWFDKGNMIFIQGIRRGDNFMAKTYKSTPGHTLYHIDEIINEGQDIVLRHDRAKGELMDEEE